MTRTRLSTLLAFILMATLFLPACTANKKLTQKALYFRNISDSALAKSAQTFEPVLQKGDILYIGVITPNEKSSKLFNMPNFYAGTEVVPGGGNTSNGNTTQGYLIDETGNIIFPYLGKLPVAGMNKTKLTDTLSTLLKKYMDSAIVTVRLLNYRVTILGEVARPGAYSIPSERVSVLDAIGLAGDMTMYGRRDRIRVIRNQNGILQSGILDINEGNIFESPYFYLRQNDVVYIEMNERKVPNTDQANIRNLGIVISVITAISVIIGTINVLK